MNSCRACANNDACEYNPVIGQWFHPAAARSPAAGLFICGFQEAPGRTGDWIQTFTGRQFFALDPRPDDLHILDIAAGLRNARYSSQSILIETVAEHSVLIWRIACARGLSPRLRRTALMHDASEAYLVDVPRPIKRDLANYTEIEDRIMGCVATRFDIEWPVPPEIKTLDNAILTDEREQNMGPPPAPWRQIEQVEPLGVRVDCWSADRAFLMFLHAAAIEGLV